MISGKHARSPHGAAVVRYEVNRIKPKTTFSITQPAFQKEHLAQKARIYEFFRTRARLKGLFPETTRVSRYQKSKTNLDFTEARDSECQWHQLGRMQVCTSLLADNHASTPPLSFLQAGCPSCMPPNQQRQSTEGTFLSEYLGKNE